MSGRAHAERRTVVVLTAAALLAACTSDRDAAPDPAATTVVAPTTTPTTAPASTSPSTAPPTTTPRTDPAPTTVAASTAPPTTTPPTTAPPAPPPPAAGLPGVAFALRPVNDLPKLTAMASRPDGLTVMVSQTGEVWRVADGTDPVQVLDLTDVVSPWENGSERGLLGAAFHPLDGRLYLYYTDVDIDSHLVSYAVAPDGGIDPATVREVLFVDQPGLGHKGGGIAFTPDGTLFLALGDGGASDGRDAQDDTKLLGTIIRIVPRLDGPGYDVAPDNPFVGVPGAAPEIWATGLRNPWGLGIDPPTGDLWTGDVGNHTMEEIDRLPAGVGGQNFGWYWIEGTSVRVQGAPPDVVGPVFAYRHDEVGPAVVGGRVYRGSALPGLQGAYVFGDLTGVLFAIGAGDETVRLDPQVSGVLTGFGTDAAGELYVLTLQGGAFQLVPA